MGAVISLPMAVACRFCPRCGFIVDQLQIVAIRLNLPCPSCKAARLSKFLPVAVLTQDTRRRRRIEFGKPKS